MTLEARSDPQHPEGLTPEQENLAAMFFDTKTEGKVRSRYQNPDGSYRFEETTRKMGIIDFPQNEHEFAIRQHDKEPDAPLSKFYVNLRNLDKDVLDQIGVVMREMTPSFEINGNLPSPDVCAGVPSAGVPLAEAYSKATGIPIVEIFDKDGRRIVHKEASVQNKSIRLIDDLASQGITKLESVEEAQKMGYIVDSFYVLIDREQGGIDALRKVIPDVRFAFKISQLFKFGLRTERISRKQYDEAMEYLHPSS